MITIITFPINIGKILVTSQKCAIVAYGLQIDPRADLYVELAATSQNVTELSGFKDFVKLSNSEKWAHKGSFVMSCPADVLGMYMHRILLS